MGQGRFCLVPSDKKSSRFTWTKCSSEVLFSTGEKWFQCCKFHGKYILKEKHKSTNIFNVFRVPTKENIYNIRVLVYNDNPTIDVLENLSRLFGGTIQPILDGNFGNRRVTADFVPFFPT